ncbi:hypothetical protein EI94DRAFT_1809244 [Lactarius quietus]|nr:hypothetical protein EI94DRAFT_1809244 [Lactarius quietus]
MTAESGMYDGDEVDICAISLPDAASTSGSSDSVRFGRGHREMYIICPAAIIGSATGPVPSTSFFLHAMMQLALGFKKAVYVKEGPNVFHSVLLEDLVDLLFTRIQGHDDVKASPKLPGDGDKLTLIARPPERSIPSDDDNPEPQLTNDDIMALPMIGDVNSTSSATSSVTPDCDLMQSPSPGAADSAADLAILLSYPYDTLGIHPESFFACTGASNGRSIALFLILGVIRNVAVFCESECGSSIQGK